MSLAVIGIGSPLGADNIASVVINMLRKKFENADLNQQIHFGYHDKPGINLLDIIEPFDTVHFVDAIVTGQVLGTLHRYDDWKVFKNIHQHLSSHANALAETLLLGESLYSLPKRVVVHAIEVEPPMKMTCIPHGLIGTSQQLADQITKELNDS